MSYWSKFEHNPAFNDKVDIWSLGITISELYIASTVKDEMFNQYLIYNPFKENLIKS